VYFPALSWPRSPVWPLPLPLPHGQYRSLSQHSRRTTHSQPQYKSTHKPHHSTPLSTLGWLPVVCTVQYITTAAPLLTTSYHLLLGFPTCLLPSKFYFWWIWESSFLKTWPAHCSLFGRKNVQSVTSTYNFESPRCILLYTPLPNLSRLWHFCGNFLFIRGPGSSVGIATELRARRSGIESRWGREFPPVQTGPEAHPASCKIGTGSFLGVKCGRGVLLPTHPLLVPRSWKSRAIPPPTLWRTINIPFYHTAGQTCSSHDAVCVTELPEGYVWKFVFQILSSVP